MGSSVGKRRGLCFILIAAFSCSTSLARLPQVRLQLRRAPDLGVLLCSHPPAPPAYIRLVYTWMQQVLLRVPTCHRGAIFVVAYRRQGSGGARSTQYTVDVPVMFLLGFVGGVRMRIAKQEADLYEVKLCPWITWGKRNTLLNASEQCLEVCIMSCTSTSGLT